MQQQPITLTSQQARGGEIILDSHLRRLIFMSGLVGFVVSAGMGAIMAIA